MLPFSFPIPAHPVNAGVSVLSDRERKERAEKKGGKKTSEMHSLPYSGENVSGSQQTTRQALRQRGTG